MTLLSLVIPTKNRYTTLIPIVNALLYFGSSDFEIVIQDNTLENQEFLNFLESNSDTRIKYFHSTSNLSQTENSNLAVANASGEFICFIGDDDIVMPYVINVVKWMKQMNIDVLKAYKPDYYWPGLPAYSTSSVTTGVLTYKDIRYSYKFIDSKYALSRTLAIGGTRIDFLPSLYHGIVSKAVLEKVYAQAKSYFPGPSPDMASAVAISLIVDRFVHLNVPVVISGKSSASIGGLGVLHLHIKQLKGVSHLPSDTEEKWDSRIPKIWTGQTIWAQSLHTAICEMQRKELLKGFNYTYLMASLYLFNFRNRREIFFNRSHYQNLFFYIHLIKQFSYRTSLFLRNRLIKSDIKRISDLSSISKASDYLSRIIDSSRAPWFSKTP